ncbi:MAG: response regulator [Desulfobulbaceae bacterium]|nr:response regulator [Desulfobulbaceae bacterium]
MDEQNKILPIQNIGAKILIVDDDESYCKSIKRSLVFEKYDCVTTKSAKNALKLIEENEFDLLISDVMMPDISGIKLLLEVKERWPDLAVVMISGMDNRDIFIRCLQAGAYGYLIKPFSESQLLINIINALERQRLVSENKRLKKKYESN